MVEAEQVILPWQPVNMVELDLRESEDLRPEPEGVLEELILCPDPSKTTKIVGSMGNDLKL